MNDKKFSDTVLQEVTNFAEWRGTVKEAIKHLAAAIERFEKATEALWAAIDELRNHNRECRERCDKVSCQKAEKADLKDIKNEIKQDMKEIQNDVSDQGKSQIRQQVTLMFYGVIGGALFSLLLMLAGKLYEALKG